MQIPDNIFTLDKCILLSLQATNGTELTWLVYSWSPCKKWGWEKKPRNVSFTR